MSAEFSEKHAASRVEPRHERRVGVRHVVDEDLRMCGGADAGRVVDVFQAERNAVHVTAIMPSHDFRLGVARLLESEVRGDGDERVHALVQPEAALKQGASQARREIASLL